MPTPAEDKNATYPNKRLARLRIFNPRRGHVMQSYSTLWNGVRYEITQKGGWVWVPLSLAKYLEQMPARSTVVAGGEGEEDFPRAFVICSSIADAEAFDAKEKRSLTEHRTPAEARRFRDQTADLRTSDLRPKRIDELYAEEEAAGKPTPVRRRTATPAPLPTHERIEVDFSADEEGDEEIALLLARINEIRAKKRAGQDLPPPPPPPALDVDQEKDEAEEEEDEARDLNDGSSVSAADFGEPGERAAAPRRGAAKKAAAKKGKSGKGKGKGGRR